MDVAERCCEQVTPTDRVEPARDFERVLGRCVKLGRVVTDDIILLTADRAGLDFQHELVLRKALEQLRGNIEVFLQRKIAAVEHVSGKKIRSPRRAALLRFGNKGKNKFVQFVFQTVVGMQRDVDRITLRGSMDVLRDRYRAKRRVLDGRAGRECAAARGNLNDAVGCALGKSAQNGIGGSE